MIYSSRWAPLIAGIALISFPSASQAQLDIKDIFGGGGIKIPGLDKIPGLEGGARALLNDDALTTNIKDASNGLPFLDGFSPKRFNSLSRLKHTASGAFEMQPGAYAGVVRSYCLHAGTYGPTQGSGYLNAPLKGKRAGIINKLLHIDTSQPGAPSQSEMQSLIWAVLARGKYSDFSPNFRNIGDRYLTPEERFELDGGAIGLIPEDIKQKLYNKLDSFIKPLVDAQIQMRSFANQANVPFQTLEKVAVLTGEPPSHKDDRNVPTGRWLIQKNGIFTRYQPSGYSRTRIDSYVPERFLITTDASGRITRVDGPKDKSLEFAYGEATLNTGSKDIQGFPITSVKFSGNSSAGLENTGWTFVGATPKKITTKDEGVFSGTQLRFQQAQLRQSQVNDVKKEFPRDKKVQGDWPVPNKVYNLLHLRDALANAYWSVQKTLQGEEVNEFLTKATMAELSDWTTNRQAITPLSLFACLTFGGPLYLPEAVGYEQGEQVPELDPSPNPAMPARVYSQRIGLTTTVISDQTFGFVDIDDEDDDLTKLEDIPGIMRARKWTMGPVLMDRWFGGTGLKANPLEGDGPYDFSLDVVTMPELNIEFSRRTQVANSAYLKITDPENWNGNQAIGAILKEKYSSFYKNISAGKRTPFSGDFDYKKYLSNLKAFHRQQVQFSSAPTTYVQGGVMVLEGFPAKDADHFASLGGIVYYAIPKGYVTRLSNETLSFEITDIAVYVLDSYDFNDNDEFGWWKKPNELSHSKSKGGVFASDRAFSDYRKVTGRGQDFLILIPPVVIHFPKASTVKVRT